MLVNRLFTEYRSKAWRTGRARVSRCQTGPADHRHARKGECDSFVDVSTFRCVTTIRMLRAGDRQRHLRRRCRPNRVHRRLRQRDGISYGAGTGLMLGSKVSACIMDTRRDRAPQNAVKAEQALRERSRARATRWIHGQGSRGRQGERCRSARRIARRTGSLPAHGAADTWI